MTLLNVLTALKENEITITIVQGENELIKFNAAGYEAIEGDIGAKIVTTITIKDSKHIAVTIEE